MARVVIDPALPDGEALANEIARLALIPIFSFTDFTLSAYREQRQLLGEALGATPFRAPGTGFFAAETEVRNRPPVPSGNRRLKGRIG